jgi:hypothetical protein
MKKIITTLSLILATSFVFAEAEVKEVCHDKTDKSGKIVTGKDGKPTQTCKKVKVHKKLEGTKIPEKK